jgi:hypothetical protein
MQYLHIIKHAKGLDMRMPLAHASRTSSPKEA